MNQHNLDNKGVSLCKSPGLPMLSFVNFLFLSLGASASTENCEDYEDEESDWKKCDAELKTGWEGSNLEWEIDGKLAEQETDSHQ